MKRKMGRPKVPKAQAKAMLFAARFAPDEAKTISKAISDSGQSKTEWIRASLLSAASPM